MISTWEPESSEPLEGRLCPTVHPNWKRETAESLLCAEIAWDNFHVQGMLCPTSRERSILERAPTCKVGCPFQGQRDELLAASATCEEQAAVDDTGGAEQMEMTCDLERRARRAELLVGMVSCRLPAKRWRVRS